MPTPDILYISYERLPANWDENEACPVPPDLVIEIISPFGFESLQDARGLATATLTAETAFSTRGFAFAKRLVEKTATLSPGQTFGQITAKAKDYLDAKVLRVWVVDIKARSITVFYPDAAPQTYMRAEILTDILFEGLEFTAGQVFQKAKIPSNS